MFIAGISSCKNSITSSNASIQVINASPDAGTINLYLSGSLKTSTPVSYGNTSGYFTTTAGNQAAEVKSASSTLTSTTINLSDKGNYSLFVTGLSAANSVTTVFLPDDLTSPSSGKAKVRFVNTVDSSPQVNLVANSTTWFNGVSYKSATGFMEITPGTYTLSANSTTITAISVASLSQNFESGKIYTVYFKGILGGSNASKLSLGVVPNN